MHIYNIKIRKMKCKIILFLFITGALKYILFIFFIQHNNIICSYYYANMFKSFCIPEVQILSIISCFLLPLISSIPRPKPTKIK